MSKTDSGHINFRFIHIIPYAVIDVNLIDEQREGGGGGSIRFLLLGSDPLV